MKPDPAIDEIREVRRKISAECGHDPRRLVAHYVEYQERLRREGKFRFYQASAEEPLPILRDKPRSNHES